MQTLWQCHIWQHAQGAVEVDDHCNIQWKLVTVRVGDEGAHVWQSIHCVLLYFVMEPLNYTVEQDKGLMMLTVAALLRLAKTVVSHVALMKALSLLTAIKFPMRTDGHSVSG